MGLLSPPTDEMRAAARALIHDQHLPPVGDETLRTAIEQIRSELQYEKQVFKDIDHLGRKPAKSRALEALELALAQRISSARLALAAGKDEPELGASDPPVSAPMPPRDSRGR